MSTKPDLSAAYSLKTAEDSVRLYADWAESYEDDFVAAEDYRMHQHAAAAFAQAGGEGPVLDVGAGTGVCGAALAALGIGPIDATDISSAMLAQAIKKGVYRRAIEADINKPLPATDTPYAGMVSSGTFTTGHVGPDAIDTLLDACRPGALLSLGVNARHFASAGFEAKFQALMQGKITDLTLTEVNIYGPRNTSDHRDDKALIALFRKA
ncbi:class I SAM-dependent DNA methyltransferase [Albibacillus kandeliae]|uniref:class I SAM-dependent DNA methyltransferase n=1 Tax=Albibacillus kandeliae TaxID=2174228 RepID=UPI000D68B3A9|nr:class I SAM-dependent methyltransferase [Albibacillus kandeliae]